jgi:hypothetical protein
MAACKFCKQPAGWFRYAHSECRAAHREAQQVLPEVVARGIHDGVDLAEAVEATKAQGWLTDEQAERLVLEGFARVVEEFLDDETLDEQEESILAKALETLPVSEEAKSQSASVRRLVRATIIQNLRNGEPLTNRMSEDGLPFLFQKSEELIWAFAGVTYFENRTRTEYVGGSNGVSVRIAKGVYYRTGRFRGERIQTEEMKELGTGILALTTKHIYFHSSQRAFKVPFRKIVSLQTYEDGILVQRDGTTTRPQLFQGLDGWFASNIISHVADQ